MGPGGEHADQVVAVVGATGRQGSAVVRHLLADGWPVRALTRDPSGAAARALAAQGAELHRVDTEDVDSLRPALQGAYGLFNVQNPMTSSLDAEVRQGRNVARAAADARVDHVVYGAAGVGEEPTGVGSWDSKLVVSQHFRQAGLTPTVLRPMAFMEIMADRGYYPALAAWGVMPRLVGPDRSVGWLGAEDVGAVAARVFADPDRWRGVSVSLVADVQSLEQCRQTWLDVAGRAPRGVPLPAGLFERLAGRAGADLTSMWRWLATHDLDFSTSVTRELLPDALTVRGWVARHAAVRA